MFTSQASCFKKTLTLTSGSARRCESPTTNTRFRCTTLTLARCLRFSVTFCFFSFCFCFFSFFILWISSCERGLYTAGSSGYGCKRKKAWMTYVPIVLALRNVTRVKSLDSVCNHEDLIDASPFYTQDTARSHLCGCGANRSDRSDSHRCMGRSWHHQSPAVPCTGGTPWGHPSSQGCGTSYSAAKLQIEATVSRTHQ